MKKIICMLLGLLLIGTAFCQDFSENEKADVQQTESIKPKVEFLINSNLKKNVDEISTLALKLTDSEKMDLYKNYEKTSMTPVLLNTLVGFGLGSYTSGDKTGGIIGTCLDAAAIMILCAGVSAEQKRIKEVSEYQAEKILNPGHVDLALENESNASFSVFPYLLIIAAARTYGGIRANSYTKKYNKTLAGALGVNSIQTSFAPVIDPNGNLALGFNATIRF